MYDSHIYIYMYTYIYTYAYKGGTFGFWKMSPEFLEGATKSDLVYRASPTYTFATESHYMHDLVCPDRINFNFGACDLGGWSSNGV